MAERQDSFERAMAMSQDLSGFAKFPSRLPEVRIDTIAERGGGSVDTKIEKDVNFLRAQFITLQEDLKAMVNNTKESILLSLDQTVSQEQLERTMLDAETRTNTLGNKIEQVQNTMLSSENFSIALRAVREAIESDKAAASNNLWEVREAIEADKAAATKVSNSLIAQVEAVQVKIDTSQQKQTEKRKQLEDKLLTQTQRLEEQLAAAPDGCRGNDSDTSSIKTREIQLEVGMMNSKFHSEFAKIEKDMLVERANREAAMDSIKEIEASIRDQRAVERANREAAMDSIKNIEESIRDQRAQIQEICSLDVHPRLATLEESCATLEGDLASLVNAAVVSPPVRPGDNRHGTATTGDVLLEVDRLRSDVFGEIEKIDLDGVKAEMYCEMERIGKSMATSTTGSTGIEQTYILGQLGRETNSRLTKLEDRNLELGHFWTLRSDFFGEIGKLGKSLLDEKVIREASVDQVDVALKAIHESIKEAEARTQLNEMFSFDSNSRLAKLEERSAAIGARGGSLSPPSPDRNSWTDIEIQLAVDRLKSEFLGELENVGRAIMEESATREASIIQVGRELESQAYRVELVSTRVDAHEGSLRDFLKAAGVACNESVDSAAARVEMLFDKANQRFVVFHEYCTSFHGHCEKQQQCVDEAMNTINARIQLVAGTMEQVLADKAMKDDFLVIWKGQNGTELSNVQNETECNVRQTRDRTERREEVGDQMRPGRVGSPIRLPMSEHVVSGGALTMRSRSPSPAGPRDQVVLEARADQVLEAMAGNRGYQPATAQGTRSPFTPEEELIHAMNRNPMRSSASPGAEFRELPAGPRHLTASAVGTPLSRYRDFSSGRTSVPASPLACYRDVTLQSGHRDFSSGRASVPVSPLQCHRDVTIQSGHRDFSSGRASVPVSPGQRYRDVPLQCYQDMATAAPVPAVDMSPLQRNRVTQDSSRILRSSPWSSTSYPRLPAPRAPSPGVTPGRDSNAMIPVSGPTLVWQRQTLPNQSVTGI